ncbi:MAG: alpha-amylase family glycosyl hydrolase, partial [Bacteroidota bacterium]
LVFSINFSCKQASTTAPVDTKEENTTWTKPRVPDWHKNATIYEVNLRHYTEENTFTSFIDELPRLKEMGIDILWFMPIHEVSKEKRKGELGSPYAVKDYYGVNPDFGTMDNFKSMLKAIHEQGMYCIIDWVPNHTGWDNAWITEHPDWYTKGKDGEITDPINPGTGESWGWTDVADLNYDNQEMRQGMIDAMIFWIKDVGIDGFRVDVAHGVPVDFWVEASNALYAIEPIFMLAEAAVPDIVNNGAFVMDYAWEMHHTLNDIAKSQAANKDATAKLVDGNLVEGTDADEEHKATALAIDEVLARRNSNYNSGYQMQFTSNHDENSWAGTEFARMGAGHQTFAVLTATFDGMPLIYTGQESAMDQRLEFFRKDTIDWGTYEYAGFYKTLFELKHRNEALWNGAHGGALVKIATGNDEHIYAFQREKNGNRVVVLLNLSSTRQSGTLEGSSFAGSYKDIFSGETINLMADQEIDMDAWEYKVYEKNKD